MAPTWATPLAQLDQLGRTDVWPTLIFIEWIDLNFLIFLFIKICKM